MKKRTYTGDSNLVNDKELMCQFMMEARKSIRYLKGKYYSLFEYYSEDDIIQEVYDKILRQDISFKESKGCSLSSFSRMMVNNRCIDLSRRIKKHEVCQSMDLQMPCLSGVDEKSVLSCTLGDFMSEDNSNDFKEIELQEIISSFEEEMLDFPIKKVINMLREGYSTKEVSEILGFKNSRVIRQNVKSIESVFRNRISESKESETLADVLYGSEEELESRKEGLKSSLAYIKDSESNMKLSDVIGYVIEGKTYKEIGQALKVTEREVKSFLSRYESMVV